MMDADQVFAQIGPCGRQQQKWCIYVFLGQCMAACQLVLMVFVGATPDFFCIDSKDQTKRIHNYSTACLDYKERKCDTFVFDSDWVTIPQEWNLVCTEAYRAKLVQSGLMAGFLIGSLVWGFVSDAIGRYKTTLIVTAVIACASFLSSMVTFYEYLLLLRFIVGFGIAGHAVATFVLCNECLGSEYRAAFSVLISVFFALGIASLSIFAQIATDWRQLTQIISLIAAGTFVIYCKLPESPRWLLSQGRVSEARGVFERIARGNGAKSEIIQNWDNEMHEHTKLVAKQSPTSANAQSSMADFFKHPSLFVLLVVQLYSWFANSMVYYGLTLAAGSLSSSLHLSVVLSGLAEVPAYLMIFFAQNSTGRRTLICVSLAVGSSACLCIVLSASAATTTALALIGKMGVSASFAMVWLHSAELFPTAIRNGGLGICSMAARVGGVLAPFVSLAAGDSPSGQFVIFGLVGLVAAVLNLNLPETKDKSLPDSAEDLLMMTKSTRKRTPS